MADPNRIGLYRNAKRAGWRHGLSVEGVGNKGSQSLKDVWCIERVGLFAVVMKITEKFTDS